MQRGTDHQPSKTTTKGAMPMQSIRDRAMRAWAFEFAFACSATYRYLFDTSLKHIRTRRECNLALEAVKLVTLPNLLQSIGRMGEGQRGL